MLLVIPKVLSLPMKMKLASSGSAAMVGRVKTRLASSASAAMVERFAAYASYSTSISTSSSRDQENILLMLPSHEAKDPSPEIQPYKWRDSCFYDVKTKSFVTSHLQIQSIYDVGEMPRIVGSSHGFLAMLRPYNCSLFLIKIPSSNVDASRPTTPGVYPFLPSIDTLPAFSHRLKGLSEHPGGYDRSTAGFIRKDTDGGERLETPREVADYFVGKIVMSSSNDSGSSPPTLVMACHSGRAKLAFCVGCTATRWINLETDWCFSDVIYRNADKKFYAIKNCFGPQIEVWDLNDPKQPKQEILDPRLPLGEFKRIESYITSIDHSSKEHRYYLVESMGEILLVIRYYAYHAAEDGTSVRCDANLKCELPYGTSDFDVFKLSASGDKLDRVKDLGDQALFLGINHSFAASATEFSGIQGNSIYFGDHYMRENPHFREEEGYPFGGHDCGIFNMEDRCISGCYPNQSKKLLHPPVWIAPN